MEYRIGQVVQFKSGGLPMVVALVTAVTNTQTILKLFWLTVDGTPQTLDIDAACVQLFIAKGTLTMNEKHLLSLGIPQDVIDAANQVKMDLETLGQLCVAHSVQAARDFLAYLAGKLPGGNL